MQFRPCIDIHNGEVKQIIGSSLSDKDNAPKENFVATKGADYFASLYKKNNLSGGHIILLNKEGTEEYTDSKNQALRALMAFPGGMQIGGGIHADNAAQFIAAGASHVIVTSYVFHEGKIDYERLKLLRHSVGKEHVVLDVSCKRVGDDYFVVTDRWQKMTEEKVTLELLTKLSEYCDEFLIHAVDVEGKQNGIETDLVKLLSMYRGNPITYAGGVHSFADLDTLKEMGAGKIHVTIGSALDLFGGTMPFAEVVEYVK